MKKRSFLSAVTALAAFVGFVPAMQAFDKPEFSLVTPNDTFSIAVAGFATTDNTGVYLVNPITVTFSGTGVGQTFTGVAVGGQIVTVTTTQTISGANVTDSISLGVPTNFVPTGTTTSSGAVINQIELDMAIYNGGTNTLDFTPAISGTPTYAGSINYSTSSTLALTLGGGLVPTLSNNNASLAYYESVGSGTTPITNFAIKQFNFSITYAVPEPSTYALCALGLAGFAGVVVRCRRAQV